MQVASLADVINQGAFKSSVTHQGQNFEICLSFDMVLNRVRICLCHYRSLAKFCFNSAHFPVVFKPAYFNENFWLKGIIYSHEWS